MAEFKVRLLDNICRISTRYDMTALCQNKLEAQYVARREASIAEVADLKQQLELRSNEIRSLNATIDSMKNVNEELKVYTLLNMVLF